MSEMGLIGLKSRYQQGCVPFEEFISLPLSSHNVHCIPWHLSPFHLLGQQQQVKSCSRGITLKVSASFHLCYYIGPI